jgi:hypothetical protein
VTMARPRLQWVRTESAFVLVVAAVAAAAIYLWIAPGHWRRATLAMAAALMLAGMLRLTLPPRHVGMLAVRRRWIDVACYLAMGGVILAVDLRLH